MGTRADFYAGRGKGAEWLGSIAWDGYHSGIPDAILYAHDETTFRNEVAAFLASRGDATTPDQGWPWPWDTSSTTDCSYWFFDGKCWDAHHEYDPAGRVFAPFDKDRPQWDGKQDEDEFYTAWLVGKPVIEYPDMSAKKNVAWDNRSGLLSFHRP